MSETKHQSTSATVITTVEGIFPDDAASRAAMLNFTDKVNAEGQCQWHFRDSSKKEWSIRFVQIKDLMRFNFVVRDYLGKMGITGMKITIRTHAGKKTGPEIT